MIRSSLDKVSFIPGAVVSSNKCAKDEAFLVILFDGLTKIEDSGIASEALHKVHSDFSHGLRYLD